MGRDDIPRDQRRDCRTCKFSEARPFEDEPNAIVCMRYPPASHPLYPAGEPVMIGTCSMRAPLRDGEWCYEYVADLAKATCILVPK